MPDKSEPKNEKPAEDDKPQQPPEDDAVLKSVRERTSQSRMDPHAW